MPTACINHPGARVHLTSERLEVFGRREPSGPDYLLREIPIRDLDRLIVLESVHLTAAALAALLRAGIPVNVLGWNGDFLGGFLPATNRHGLARLRQYQRTLDPAFALQLAGRIVSAKIYNQRRVLQRLRAGRETGLPQDPGAAPAPGVEGGPAPVSGVPVHAVEPAPAPASDAPPAAPDLEATLRWLDGLFQQLGAARTIDELRGYEGASTARYFQAWAEFLPAAFPFERRTTRPPLNPVNACISFGATVLYSETVAFIQAHGLDPALGLLHHTEDGRWSLALDLMEPFRPVLVEALALDLFSHQILAASHFEPRNGGVYLDDEGRHRFFLQYERRMERQFLSECAGHRTTLRQQLEQQAVMFKAALEDPARLQPFLIN